MTWHPLLAADERTPGVWTLVDSMGRDYGQVAIIRRAGEVGYKAVFDGQTVGYYTTLRTAVEETHAAFIRSHGPSGTTAARYPLPQ